MDGWVTLTTLLLLMVVVPASAVTVVRDDAGDALYLTPLIRSGSSMQDAKRMSQVHAYWTGRVKSHAGYITVNDTYGSNLFFWFFPTKNQSAPLLLWLNGGPGHPSTIGALLENGPLALTKGPDGAPRVTMRKTSWVEKFHMLYIDSPVGSGYSFTRDPAGDAKTMDDVVPNLYSAMIQFYQMFSEYQSNDLYIGGQSYAGKYIPALGKYIHDRNQGSPLVHLPMRGVYIGAGLCDAELMFPEFPEALYYAGLISNKSRHDLRVNIHGMMQRSIATGRTTQQDIDLVLVGSVNSSENGDVSNILGLKAMVSQYVDTLDEFMNMATTREALHVGQASAQPYLFINLTIFYVFIELDLFVSTNRENAFLMENYKVLHYTGNLDQVVGVAMTEAFLNELDWSGRDWYRRHYNVQWWSHDQDQKQKATLMGWYAKLGNFTRVIVRNAGHHVPHSQPEAALQMMTNFVFDLPFRGRPTPQK